MSGTPVAITIDRSSPIPLYHQLAEQLRRAIDQGMLEPGESIENEMAMVERLQLSRPTVRRALQDLVSDGLLVRRRGLGTKVANRRIHRRLGLTSLYDDLARVGRTPTTQIIGFRREDNAVAAAALALPPKTELLSVVRLRLADETPIAILHNWLPPAFSDIPRQQLEDQGLYAVLRQRGAGPTIAQQSIGARTPTSAERRRLKMGPRVPLLTMQRAAFSAAGEPVEFGDHCYRADSYQFEVTVD